MKLKILAILMLVAFIPAFAITGAGMATHHADYLQGMNPWETAGYMTMSNVAWALPFKASHWIYEHYSSSFYEPAAHYLQSEFPNSHLEHWEPWSPYAKQNAPHFSSFYGAGAGVIVALLPSLLIGMLQNEDATESTDDRKQKPKKKPKPKKQKIDPKILRIGDQNMTPGEEIRHILCVGAPRSGKSQVVQTAAKVALKRREPAFVLDHNGELFSRLYKPSRGDILISAYDKRSVKWSPLAELTGEASCKRIGHALIGDGQGGDSSEWVNNAVTYTSACLQACLILHKQGRNVTNQTLIDFMKSATAESLLPIIGYGHIVGGLFNEGAEKMLSSIQGVAIMRADALSSLNPDAGFNDFSITRHVTKERKKEFLFAVSAPDAENKGKELASIVTGVYINAINKLPEKEDNRSWLLADEAGRYPSIAGFGDGVTNGGKRGMAVVAAVQTLSQLDEAYGEKGKNTLLGCFATRIMFQTPDSETSKWMSEQIGKARRIKTSHTSSESTSGTQTNQSSSTQKSEQIEEAVLPHEFVDQQVLNAFITRPTKMGYKRIVVSPTDLGNYTVEPFVERELVIYPNANNGTGNDSNESQTEPEKESEPQAETVETEPKTEPATEPVQEQEQPAEPEQLDDKPADNTPIETNTSANDDDDDEGDDEALINDLKS